MDAFIINASASDQVEINASVTVKNTGQYDGAEVLQAYLSFPAVADEPPQLLRGFEKVFLQKGEEQRINFVFKKTELSYYDVNSHSWVVPKGEFEVRIGASSRDIRGTAKFTLN